MFRATLLSLVLAAGCAHQESVKVTVPTPKVEYSNPTFTLDPRIEALSR